MSMSMSMPMSSMSAAKSMATGMTEEVQDTAWAMRVWPVCNNITDHGPNSAQKAPSDIRKAMMSNLDSYYGMQKYSNITAAICLALVALTVAPSLLREGRTRWPLQSRRFARLPWAGPRMVAAFRRFAYQRWHFSLGGRVKVSMAEASHMAVITAVSAGLIAWCFAIKPYYRCTREWGSPPLGIRAGMIANALIPFLFALATKVNFVSILTSISHQRLQLYHQWAARLALFFGIVHTLPFIIQPLREGGSANLYRYWYESGGPDYWTGAVSLALMVWMIVSSTSVFRRMGYEFFVFQHLTSIVLFLIFYFMHTADTLSTWTPLWASVALWGAAYFIRWAKSAFASRFFVSMSARVEILEPSLYLEEESSSGDDMVRISLQTPLRWSPGQHIYVRLTSLSPLQCHPFTIVTLPSPNVQRESTIVLMARVQQGMTRRLYEQVVKQGSSDWTEDATRNSSYDEVNKAVLEKADAVASKTLGMTLPVAIDGPYGCNASIASFDEAIVVAGGSGFTFVLPVLFDLAWRARAGAEAVRTRSVTIVWSVRTAKTLVWMQEQLNAAVASLEAVGIVVSLNLHITRGQLAADVQQERQAAVQGRPKIGDYVARAVQSAKSEARSTSMVLAVCGPESMADEVQLVARDLQTDILHSRLGCLQEVYLLKEAFGW